MHDLTFILRDRLRAIRRSLISCRGCRSTTPATYRQKVNNNSVRRLPAALAFFRCGINSVAMRAGGINASTCLYHAAIRIRDVVLKGSAYVCVSMSGTRLHRYNYSYHAVFPSVHVAQVVLTRGVICTAVRLIKI